jgi:pyruvate/2-oxoglutarate dehydrogenase complex dihydrolipoamide dehydrogenase (E3) component
VLASNSIAGFLKHWVRNNRTRFIKIDDFQKNLSSGIFAAGDNTTFFRAVSLAFSAETKTGAFINKELIDEIF